MDISTAKAIPIQDLLSILGYPILKSTSAGHWYRAPTRHENTPSFKLSPDGYAWFDHGTGEGGNILDLAYRLHTKQPLSGPLNADQLREALAFLDQVLSAGPTSHRQLTSPPSIVPYSAAYTLVNQQPFPLEQPDRFLIQAAHYLRSRGIQPGVVAPYLLWITYRGNDGQTRTGFGLPNLAGGFELRRAGDWAKTVVGPKHITIFRADRVAAVWHTFYSLIDFCSFLTVDRPPIGAYHYLIINSDNLVAKAVTYLANQPVGVMMHYPHLDASGQHAYRLLHDALLSWGWQQKDRSSLYAGSKDWTEQRQKEQM